MKTYAANELWVRESSLQKAVARYLDAVLDPAHARFTHIPSGGKRNPITARNLKLDGVKPGFPDVMILYMGRVLFIELKRTKNSRVSDPQADFVTWANLNGFPTVICKTLGGVEAALKHHGVPTRLAKFDPHVPIEDLALHFSDCYAMKRAP